LRQHSLLQMAAEGDEGVEAEEAGAAAAADAHGDGCSQSAGGEGQAPPVAADTTTEQQGHALGLLQGGKSEAGADAAGLGAMAEQVLEATFPETCISNSSSQAPRLHTQQQPEETVVGPSVAATASPPAAAAPAAVGSKTDAAARILVACRGCSQEAEEAGCRVRVEVRTAAAATSKASSGAKAAAATSTAAAKKQGQPCRGVATAAAPATKSASTASREATSAAARKPPPRLQPAVGTRSRPHVTGGSNARPAGGGVTKPKGCVTT
jgi:hypothetical protein